MGFPRRSINSLHMKWTCMGGRAPPFIRKRRNNMAWTTPELCEICVGMEVTSYLSAEI
ncbi:pyrroloquinoline quinone precursor peptide PqqA [Rhodoblastus sp. 17X3]|uniref:pyrroloquinoline quinone precursor peptide PqqA n=1 Tax=Rhodoblastus sp. 17X3 TaxID=3047026 RepID=UPI00406CEDF4